MIEPVAAVDVPSVWEQAAAALRAPLRVLGERNAHDVLIDLVTGKSQLWHLTGDGADAWAVTEIREYPRKRVARATFCAGRLARGSVEEMRNAFTRWGAALGASELRIRGRKGWGRFMPDAAVTMLFRFALAPCAPALETSP